MDERRVRKLSQAYILFADTERQVMPIIGKCLEGIARAGTNVNEKNVSVPCVVSCLLSGYSCFSSFTQGTVACPSSHLPYCLIVGRTVLPKREPEQIEDKVT